MIEGSRRIRGASLKCLFVLAGVAGSAPATASAQLINDFVAQDRVVWSPVATTEGKLSVQASPQVLYSGQSSNVNVFAHLAGSPAPYAFASSTFDFYASDSAWSFASDGAIVGNDVLGASASQAHMPRLGQLADSSNPFRVWHGVFTPQSKAPALIEIKADPTDFSVYPNMFTSSSAQCDAEGGSGYILVNPLRVGRWLAVPREGTAILADDATIIGRRDAGENTSSVKIATFFCPSDPTPRGARSRNGDDSPTEMVSFNYFQAPVHTSSTRVEFDHPPESFTATVQIQGAGDDVFQWDPGDGIDLSQGYLNFELADAQITSYSVNAHAAGANLLLSDGHVSFDAYMGGLRVASGDLVGDGQLPGLRVSAVPETIGTHLYYQDTIIPAGAGQSLDGDMTWTLDYDQPVVATVLGPNGNLISVTLDRIEIRVEYVLIGTPPPPPSPSTGAAPGLTDQPIRSAEIDSQQAAQRVKSMNNLKQLSLGCHVFTAEGVQEIVITPSQMN